MQALTSSCLEHICNSFTNSQLFWQHWPARQLRCKVSPNVLITLRFHWMLAFRDVRNIWSESTMNNPRTHGCRRGNRHNFWRREHFQVERSRNSGGSSWIRCVRSRFSANNYLGISVLTNSRSWKCFERLRTDINTTMVNEATSDGEHVFQLNVCCTIMF